jgi:arylsulfatase
MDLTNFSASFPLREGKGTVWEGGVREPFIARWKGVLPEGKVTSEPVMAIDLLPTIARLAGAPLPELPIDGKDVWHILKNEPEAATPHEALYFYYHTNELHAVHSGKWKLYFPHTYRTMGGKEGGKGGIPAPYDYIAMKKAELYDLENDPSETTNVIDRNPGVVERLEKLAEKARQDMGDSLQKRDETGNRQARKRE